jgi:hypothetical protein
MIERAVLRRKKQEDQMNEVIFRYTVIFEASSVYLELVFKRRDGSLLFLGQQETYRFSEFLSPHLCWLRDGGGEILVLWLC